MQRVSDQLGRLQRLLAHHQRLHVPTVLLPVAPADVLKGGRVEPLGICGDEAGGDTAALRDAFTARRVPSGQTALRRLGAACGCAGRAGGIGGPHGALAACPLLLWNLTGWEGKEACLCAAASNAALPWTAARQAPLCAGLSRQESWSGGLPGGSVVKESACQCRAHGFEPRSGKIPSYRGAATALTQSGLQSPGAVTTEACVF